MKLYGTMKIDKDGVLTIGGLKATELVSQYGTPLLVLDEEEIRNNIKQYIASFEKNYDDYQIAYGGKSFLNRTICRILSAEGIGLDVVSGGELYIALAAGFPPEDIYFHGNNKLAGEVEMGLNNGIGRFVIDNWQEAELLNKMARERKETVKALLRVAPGIEAHTHEFIMTGHLDSKFGVSFVDNKALKIAGKIAALAKIDLVGIHAHIGSQIFELESYKKLISVLFDFLQQFKAKTGRVIRELDLGGGLGIAHTEEENPPGIDEFVSLITGAITDKCSEVNYPLPRIIIEPGRSIIGTAGTTLYTVGNIKNVPGNSTYVAVDGGMTDNIRPALYNARYEALLANRRPEEKGEPVKIAGKCCESGDILIKKAELPSARRGDILAIPATGAYTYSMSSNYNGLPRPAVVLVNRGSASIVNRRESYSDLLASDIIPPNY